MSIRGRLNQMQARANGLMNKADWTLDDAKAALAAAMELINMVKDGVAVTLVIDSHPAKKLLNVVTSGGTLPGRVVLDLSYSEYPVERAKFVGGPYDGESYSLTKIQQHRKVIALKDLNGDDIPEVYVWNGYEFVYQGNVEGIQL